MYSQSLANVNKKSHIFSPFDAICCVLDHCYQMFCSGEKSQRE